MQTERIFALCLLCYEVISDGLVLQNTNGGFFKCVLFWETGGELLWPSEKNGCKFTCQTTFQ